MSVPPRILTTRDDQVHPIQVKLAFLEDRERPARPAVLLSVDDDTLGVRDLDGTVGTVVVHDAARLADVLDRDDVCRIQGHPLLLVSRHRRVLGIATGPAAPPSRLEVLIVSRLEDNGVVELLSDSDDQPSWQVFALRR